MSGLTYDATKEPKYYIHLSRYEPSFGLIGSGSEKKVFIWEAVNETDLREKIACAGRNKHTVDKIVQGKEIPFTFTIDIQLPEGTTDETNHSRQ